MANVDFTYRVEGMFVAIIPESDAAEKVWSEQIAPQTDGTGKVLAIHWRQVMKQIRDAGYSVRQAPKLKKLNPDGASKLLAELIG